MFDVVETVVIPDVVLRSAIRTLLRKTLREKLASSAEVQMQELQEFIADLKNKPIAIETDTANQQHYQVDSEFFQLVLGPALKYSCALFRNENDSLAEAEQHMLDLYCKRAELKDGQRILDLGCGWGSLTTYLAAHYPKSEIYALSNSQTQRKFIETKAEKNGFQNVKVFTGNINDWNFDISFDRIVSIEMLEHMKNYELLLAKLNKWLKPDGKLFIHIFTHRILAYHYEDKGESDWLTRNFFTGGTMPSNDLLLYFQKDLTITRQWEVNGKHYERTANAWLQNMDTNQKRIMEIFRRQYGEKEARRKWIHWRLFFLACAELWGFANGEEWMVSHYLFEPRPRIPD
jgi:cyclopropane fatty-acyl-phospholipid synthase-like methyltransferase